MKSKLKDILLNLNIFKNNEYLDKYCDLIVNNLNKQNNQSIHKHHFIPVCYYKNVYKLKSRKEANIKSMEDPNNFLVKLTPANHFLAHLYLYFAIEDKQLKYAFTSIVYYMKGMYFKDLKLLDIMLELQFNPDEYNNLVIEHYELTKQFFKGNKYALGHKMPEESKKAMGDKHKGQHTKTEWKPGNKPWNKGKKLPESYKKNLRKKHGGNANHRSGKKWTDAEKIKLKAGHEKSNQYRSVRKINQYTLEGDFIKTWLCLGNIQKCLKINNITAACKGYLKSAGGFIWKYATEDKVLIKSSELLQEVEQYFNNV